MLSDSVSTSFQQSEIDGTGFKVKRQLWNAPCLLDVREARDASAQTSPWLAHAAIWMLEARP